MAGLMVLSPVGAPRVPRLATVQREDVAGPLGMLCGAVADVRPILRGHVLMGGSQNDRGVEGLPTPLHAPKTAGGRREEAQSESYLFREMCSARL